MAPLPSLLPNSSTAFERAIEQVIGCRQLMSADLISAIADPDRCPEKFLGFLAWSRSVDVWDDLWPVEKKRHVCRHAFSLHRLKTTPAGIRQHVALTGAEVTKITRPPARGFLRGAMSEAQRLSWLESLPQIRIYPFWTRGTAESWQIFFSGTAGTRFHGRSCQFMSTSRGSELLGRRAAHYDNGREVPVRHDHSDGVEQIALPRFDARRAFLGHSFHGTFWHRASVADSRVLALRPAAEDAGAIFAVPGGVKVTDVRPHRIAQRRIAPAARSFLTRHHRFQGAGFLCASFARQLVYDCYYLIDKSRVAPRQQALSWHGHGQYGIAPFTAKLRIHVPMHRPRSRSARWHGNNYARAADMAPLASAIEAVRVSKALRDTILIDTTTHRRVRFSHTLRFGDFAFGDIRKVQ